MLGVSTDTVESHKKFAAKFGLNFPLLADPQGTVVRAYGVMRSLEPLVRTARRVTFLIDGKGKIEKIWDPASAKTQNEEALAYIGEAVTH